MSPRASFLPFVQWSAKVSQPLLSTALLTGVLLTAVPFNASAIAAPWWVGAPVAGRPQPPSRTALPRQIADQVRDDLSQQFGISRRSLRITGYSRETWSDSCLGLGGPAESCLQSLVEGWRVQVTHGRQRWFYRTDLTGQVIRRENQNPTTPPPTTPPPANGLSQTVRDRILQAAAQQFGLPVSQLRIAQAERRTWNGCLGIESGPGFACTEIAISGWRVIVTGDRQSWVFHTNEDATDIRLNTAASPGRWSSVVPTFLTQERSPEMGRGIVFRTIASGGFAGQTYETLLLEDGRVLQRLISSYGASQPSQMYQVSTQQLQEFEQLLQQQFANLNGLDYPATPGAADYITVKMMSHNGVTQYADIMQNELPAALQEVIHAWEQMTSAS